MSTTEKENNKWLGIIDKETLKKYLKNAGVIGDGLLGISLLL